MDKIQTSAYEQETWKQLLGKIRDAEESEHKDVLSFIELSNAISDCDKINTSTSKSSEVRDQVKLK